jgi:mannose-1-phosphate guanylyltransferase
MSGVAKEGIVLAAGLGKRMRPVTDSLPKPLLPVTGIPILGLAARKLVGAGASKIHVNLFHLGERISEYAAEEEWPVEFHAERKLLDTGGGIGNMRESLSGADLILLHNGDILSSIRLDEAVGFHERYGAVLTMILMKPDGGIRTPPPSVITGEGGEVISIGDISMDPGGGTGALGYTGMAVLSRDALEHFPPVRKGLVEVLREMIAGRPGSVAGFDAGASAGVVWAEIGSPSSYLDIHRRILAEKTVFDDQVAPPPLALRVAEDSSVDPSARWIGFLDVGRGARIEKNASLEECVVMSGAVVEPGAGLKRCIVHAGGVLEAAD